MRSLPEGIKNGLTRQTLDFIRFLLVSPIITHSYDSPAAFSRAFSRQYGISPTTARVTNAVLKPYPKITFPIFSEERDDNKKESNDTQANNDRIDYFKKLTSPCGLDCFNCMVHEDWITKMPEEWVKRHSEIFNIPIEEMPCKGCRDRKGHCNYAPQKKCATFLCAQEKGVNYCFECADFPCKLLMPTKQGAGFPHNMKIFNLCRIKTIGFEKWIEESLKNRFTYFDGKFIPGQGPVLKE